MSNKLPAGWGKPDQSKKWHYFPLDEMNALCMRWGFYFGEREDTDDDHKDNCAECRRKVKKLRAASQQQGA